MQQKKYTYKIVMSLRKETDDRQVKALRRLHSDTSEGDAHFRAALYAATLQRKYS